MLIFPSKNAYIPFLHVNLGVIWCLSGSLFVEWIQLFFFQHFAPLFYSHLLKSPSLPPWTWDAAFILYKIAISCQSKLIPELSSFPPPNRPQIKNMLESLGIQRKGKKGDFWNEGNQERRTVYMIHFVWFAVSRKTGIQVHSVLQFASNCLFLFL